MKLSSFSRRKLKNLIALAATGADRSLKSRGKGGGSSSNTGSILVTGTSITDRHAVAVSGCKLSREKDRKQGLGQSGRSLHYSRQPGRA